MWKKIVLLATLCSSLCTLELRRVILSTNNDPNYIEFWPVVAPLWSQMGLRPTLALIADENCSIDTSLGDVIRFPPLPDVLESLHAQVIRLFLPVLFPEDGCIISDIDMIPVAQDYFIEHAKECPDDGFLVYRAKAASQYPMCYNAAKGKVFREIFGISSIQQIPGMVRQFSEHGLGWNTDEILLCAYLQEWEKAGGTAVRLGHTDDFRIDGRNWDVINDRLDIAEYTDFHCKRPYSKHKQAIDLVVAKLKNSFLDGSSGRAE